MADAAKVHHTAICTNDVEASLRFWRDGLGFAVQMDAEFDGRWRRLFDAPTDHLRSVFLGDPATPSSGILELVDLGPLPDAGATIAPATGFLLVSVYADVEATLDRLAGLGVGGEARRIEVHGVAMAVVRDPNGVRVELVGLDGA
jgi:catechol 2,3-dioxygenase-like lactoylglutathione lyase family enzyme